ncbi:MAG: methyltransferase [Candidatus Woesearchaeota archaeon]|nr:methyltransferase [Candidatus Woesearchaeota archaeon]
MIYSPQEDSTFLASFVAQYACGSVLDVGTGSGIQAATAAKNTDVTTVTAVDSNPEAIAHVTKTYPGIRSLESDMFSAVQKEQFDTIICNPPYLPGGEEPDLSGGPEGYEWSIRFLQEAKEHLRDDGTILFLFSNHTNKERIDQEVKKHYRYEQLGELALFFERLYVYRLWR